MKHRTRVLAAASGTVLLFLCIQLGALALVQPYLETGAQPVEDPSNPGNVAVFFGVVLLATGAMLVAIKYDLEQVIRGAVVLSCGWITWLVLSTVATAGFAGADGPLGSSAVLAGGPLLGAAVLVAALVFYPEWYVIDAAGIVLGSGAAGLFGLAFTPRITILFLVVLAVYDAVSVYGTEHMLTLAEGVSDLNLPVLLVVPAVPGYSLLDDAGPSTVDSDEEATDDADDASDPGDPSDADEAGDADGSGNSGDSGDAGDATDFDAVSDEPSDAESGVEPASEAAAEEPDDRSREAIYIGLGDAVMPTILVASAVAFETGGPELFDVPVVALNYPALGALIGTLVGLVVLLALVLRGRAHAGLPLLNGGAILGFLLGALASGVSLVEVLELPL